MKKNYEWNFNEVTSKKITAIYTSYLDRQHLINQEEFLINKIEIFKIAYIQMYKEILVMLKNNKIDVSAHRDRKLIRLLQMNLLEDFNLSGQKNIIFG